MVSWICQRIQDNVPNPSPVALAATPRDETLMEYNYAEPHVLWAGWGCHVNLCQVSEQSLRVWGVQIMG